MTRPSLASVIDAMNAPRRKPRAIRGGDLAPAAANEVAEAWWRAEDREALIAARAEVQRFGAELARINRGGKFARLWRSFVDCFR